MCLKFLTRKFGRVNFLTNFKSVVVLVVVVVIFIVFWSIVWKVTCVYNSSLVLSSRWNQKSDWLTGWQGHLFSCPGQLKRLWVLQTITWHFWTGFLLAEYWCVFSYYFIINVIIYVVNNRTNSVYQTQKPHFKRSRLGTYLMMAHIHGTSFPAAVSPPMIRSIKDSPQPFRWQWKHILGISPTAGGCGLGGLRSSPPTQARFQVQVHRVEDLDEVDLSWSCTRCPSTDSRSPRSESKSTKAIAEVYIVVRIVVTIVFTIVV